MSRQRDLRAKQPANKHDAYLQLATAVRDALNIFIDSLAAGPEAVSRAAADKSINASTESEDRVADWPSDTMSLQQVQVELRLKQGQIVKLRRIWGFPAPYHRLGRYHFSRREVENWARSQPNQQNLAAVLRLRRRDLQGT